ncbi:MAG TPA: TonB family protein [Pyrinomonadaceae bacterium]|nr:TonB family protein [Pyrinomonadaceae bacterium]
MLFPLLVILGSLVSLAPIENQQTTSARVAIVNLGRSGFAVLATKRLFQSLKKTELLVIDPDQSRAAARGFGYEGSLNLTRKEAMDLGAVLGCEFYVIGDVETLRRSPSSAGPYFESYATLFIVSARTGSLVLWLRPSFQAQTIKESETQLLDEISGLKVRTKTAEAIRQANSDEQNERELALGQNEPVVLEAPDEEQAAAQGLRLPRPFKRLQPGYTEEAAQAEVEATVDIVAEIDGNGDVHHARVERWAGFGLDEATLQTVKQLRFFPATRHGKPLPIRVLLRYNFRKPPLTQTRVQ